MSKVVHQKHGEVTYKDGKRLTTPEYRAWQAMRNRCLNPNTPDYSYYGGRGIAICKRWGTYVGFLADMGRRPTLQHTLDRKDGSKGYCKGNCRWATRLEQSRNRAYVQLSPDKAKTIRALYATKQHRQVDIAEKFGVSQAHVSQIIRGVSWEVRT